MSSRFAVPSLVLILTFAAGISPATAWGALGHRIVAESAALLVQDDLPTTWGPLLARHRYELGVYCFLPDARFRHIDGAGGDIEAPTHYRNLDVSPSSTSGSVDRRIAQFLDRARAQLGPVRAPKGGYQRGKTSEGDARRVFLGFYELGVMSHYSGDVAVPYHATGDSNGYAKGEGGIHLYFENECVNAFEPGLAADVLASARKNRSAWAASWGFPKVAAPGLVVPLLKDSLATVERVSELDRKHAITKLSPPGEKMNAVRKPASAGCVSMRPIVVERLAKGAVLTALLWESVLPTEVDFSGAQDLAFSDMEAEPAYPAPISPAPSASR